MCRVLLLLALIQSLIASQAKEGTKYLIGVGKADITGPVVDVNMMGYANPEQIAGGLHTRLYARAFIVAEIENQSKRALFVNMDACMASQAVTFTVIERLRDLFGSSLYSESNIILSGTHTHSGPAGYLQYIAYDITGLGFVKETFDALVEGIVLSVVRAHKDLQPGMMHLGFDQLIDGNVNRSPTAYMQNPEEERKCYEYDVDKNMTLLRINDIHGAGKGAFSWYPVHGTSINNTNTLINGDNKGTASLIMEEAMGDNFVAAFCQANVGDTSPNTLGAFCVDTGLPCDAVHSTCNGRVQNCIGRGPAWPDDFKSSEVIGNRQKDKAMQIYNDPGVPVHGNIESMHAFIDMRNVTVRKSRHTRSGRTCKPAMGFAFAAGTTDGPGAFDFKQSDVNGTLFWKIVRDFITTPSREQEDCHMPKPILLDVGEMHYPYEWIPYIVEISIMKVGNLVILAVPGEFTTMSGRRLIRAMREKLVSQWGEDIHFVIAGLSNTYSSYITTFEEYQVQRYEGGFTLFGPHTLDAYIQEFGKLADCMISNSSCDAGTPPPNLLDDQWSLVPGVIIDSVPEGKRFGQVSGNFLRKHYAVGEIAEVEFHAGCPRNNLKLEGTYIQIERKIELGLLQKISRHIFYVLKGFSIGSTWAVEYTDSDLSTKFLWYRKSTLSPYSYAKIQWKIPPTAKIGTYRIRYLGDHKSLLGTITPFEGISNEFTVD